MREFTLNNNDFIALCDLLKRTGLCENGGHAKAVIAQGLVKVDGQIELRKRCKVSSGQIIEFESEVIKVTH